MKYQQKLLFFIHVNNSNNIIVDAPDLARADRCGFEKRRLEYPQSGARFSQCSCPHMEQRSRHRSQNMPAI